MKPELNRKATEAAGTDVYSVTVANVTIFSEQSKNDGTWVAYYDLAKRHCVTENRPAMYDAIKLGILSLAGDGKSITDAAWRAISLLECE